jgi:hypothetical protein
LKYTIIFKEIGCYSVMKKLVMRQPDTDFYYLQLDVEDLVIYDLNEGDMLEVEFKGVEKKK